MAKSPAIGIDLGNSHACVGIYEDGKVTTLSSDFVQTLCYVSFDNSERLIGYAAKNQVAMNPTNTVFDAKRLIGRRFDDASVKADMKHWPFHVFNDGGKPKIQVDYKHETKTFYPEEISSMVLLKMKETAEAYIGKTITDAVITVPAYFNDSQRKATKDAGTISGLNVLRIINEPTAAAIAYALDTNLRSVRHVLFFDFGAGSFDASIIEIGGSCIEVKSTLGDTHLGGQDIDNLLVTHFIEEFKDKYKKDMSNDIEAVCKLKTACERAKIELSSDINSEVHTKSNGVNFFGKITRAKYEELCFSLFKEIMNHVENCLKDSGLCKSQIREIVLIGGSARIPQIQKLLRDFFKQSELTEFFKTEAVTRGAATFAATFRKDVAFLVFDILPMSIGTESVTGLRSTIIERNTRIPCDNTFILTTHTENQPTISFPVYEGENAMNDSNNMLGKFQVAGIPPAPKGVPKIEVTVNIDANGIMQVSAVDKSTRKGYTITITNDGGRLSEEKMEEIMEDAKELNDEDRKYKYRIHAKNRLKFQAYTIKSVVDDELLKEKCNETMKWFDQNQFAQKEEFEHKQRELEKVCMPIVTKLYQGGVKAGAGAGCWMFRLEQVCSQVLPDSLVEAATAGNEPTNEEVDE